MEAPLTAGERISNALVAMAIESLGAQARSFTGSQAGVVTTGAGGGVVSTVMVLAVPALATLPAASTRSNCTLWLPLVSVVPL